MMNFPGIINDIGEAREKVQIAIEAGKIVDGHAPGVTGEDLIKYISNGKKDGIVRIGSDHECTTPDEAIEKSSKGMFIMLRYGSSSKDLENIFQQEYNARNNAQLRLRSAPSIAQLNYSLITSMLDGNDITMLYPGGEQDIAPLLFGHLLHQQFPKIKFKAIYTEIDDITPACLNSQLFWLKKQPDHVGSRFFQNSFIFSRPPTESLLQNRLF